MNGRSTAAALAIALSFAPLPASAQTAATTTRWIASHLPTAFFSFDKNGTIRQDIQYRVIGACAIQIVTDTSTHSIISGKGLSGFPIHMTTIRLRPTTGSSFAAQQRDLSPKERPASFRGPDDNGFRITYTLDLTHVDYKHIEVVQQTLKPSESVGIGASTDGDWIEIPFHPTNSSLVPRVVRALQHAGPLCGASPEPF